MSTDAVTLFFAMLAVGAEASVVALLALALLSSFWPAARTVRDDVLDAVGPHAFVLALIVATVATSGSLYLSEVAHFTPCRLCWYQRAAMYPLVPVLALVTWRRWVSARWLVLTVALIGGSISVWHVLIERYPSLDGGTCDVTNPCNLIWVRRLGYLTIPTMALSAFALIAALMLTVRPSAPESRR